MPGNVIKSCIVYIVPDIGSPEEVASSSSPSPSTFIHLKNMGEAPTICQVLCQASIGRAYTLMELII